MREFEQTGARVAGLAKDGEHRLSKTPCRELCLIAGIGVEGDAHAGVTIQHRSRLGRNPAAPNLRQVHLVHAELLDRLAEQGFVISPGQLGENMTLRGIDLLSLPRSARLCFGGGAVVEITGLRNPCSQLNGLAPGLMEALIDRAGDGSLVRKAGVMGIVAAGGVVRLGDFVDLQLPSEFQKLEPV